MGLVIIPARRAAAGRRGDGVVLDRGARRVAYDVDRGWLMGFSSGETLGVMPPLHHGR